jgi:type VI secretion system protein ImpB
MASVHDKLERVRKPRVHIRYDVETEGGVVEKELPFVVGVLGDFAGDSKLEPLDKRAFTEINRDNFSKVMASIAPTLNLRVENTLAKDGSEMSVALKFNSMDDFEPGRIVDQVEPLRRLKEVRDRLRDLMSQADRSPELEKLLEDVLQNSGDLEALSKALAATGEAKQNGA